MGGPRTSRLSSASTILLDGRGGGGNGLNQLRVLVLGFRVSGFGFGISGFGFRASGSKLRVLGFSFWVLGLGFRVSGSGFRVPGFEFRASGFGRRASFGFRASGFGCRVSGFWTAGFGVGLGAPGKRMVRPGVGLANVRCESPIVKLNMIRPLMKSRTENLSTLFQQKDK